MNTSLTIPADKPVVIPYRLTSETKSNNKGFGSTSNRFNFQLDLKQQQKLLKNFLKQQQNNNQEDDQIINEKLQKYQQQQKENQLNHIQQGDISYNAQKIKNKYQNLPKKPEKEKHYIIPQHKANLLALQQQVHTENKGNQTTNQLFKNKQYFQQHQKLKQQKLLSKGHHYFKSLTKTNNFNESQQQYYQNKQQNNSQQETNQTQDDFQENNSDENQKNKGILIQNYTPSKNNIVQTNCQLLKEQQIWNRSYMFKNNKNNGNRNVILSSVSPFKKYEDDSAYNFNKIKINIKENQENNQDLLVKSFYNEKEQTKTQSFAYQKKNTKINQRSISMHQQQNLDTYLNIQNCYDKIDEPISKKYTAQSAFKNIQRDKFYDRQNRHIYEKPGPGEYDKDKTEYDWSTTKNIKLYKSDKDKTQQELDKQRINYKEPIQQFKEEIPQIIKRLCKDGEEGVQSLKNYINNPQNINQKKQQQNQNYFMQPSDFDKIKEKTQSHMFINGDKDRFGKSLFPIGNQDITPPVGLYNPQNHTIKEKQQIIKEKQLAQQLLKSYLQRNL